MITAETIDRLTRFATEDLPVVTAYARVTTDNDTRTALGTRLNSLAHEIKPLTEGDTLGHEAKLSVREDIERLEEAVTDERWPLRSAVAVFSCSRGGLFESLDLPRPVRDRVVVDSTPWLRPMLAVLDEYHRYCVVVLDRETAQAWELFVDDWREIPRIRDRTVRKPNYGGWYGLEEYRVHNKVDELAKKHFRRVAGVLDELFRTDGYELLIVGGHDEEVPVFLEHLPRQLRERVAGTFRVDLHTATPAIVRGNADQVVARYEREEEQRMVADTLGKAAAGGLAATGLTRCLWAGSVAAVQTLLVQEDATAPGVVCDRSRWLALEGDTCPVCGEQTRRAPDVVDELVQVVIDEGGSIEHISAETDLRQHVLAADLRFPLPPLPDGTSPGT